MFETDEVLCGGAVRRMRTRLCLGRCAMNRAGFCRRRVFVSYAAMTGGTEPRGSLLRPWLAGCSRSARAGGGC